MSVIKVIGKTAEEKKEGIKEFSFYSKVFPISLISDKRLKREWEHFMNYMALLIQFVHSSIFLIC